MVRVMLVFGLGLLACGEVMGAPSSTPAADEARLEEGGRSPSLAPSAPTVATASPSASPSASAAALAPTPTPPVDAGCAPIEHDNGVGQVYLSCAPLGTIDEAAAWLACEAYVAGPTGGSCRLRSGGTCVGKAVVSVGMIARSATNAAWDFGTSVRGHVATYPDAAPIGCPSAADPTWN